MGQKDSYTTIEVEALKAKNSKIGENWMKWRFEGEGRDKGERRR